MAQSVVKNLTTAKALIDTPEKWIKGDYQHVNCFCTVGALAVTLAIKYSEVPLTRESDALKIALPKGWVSIHHFNDAPDTNHADVMALFDRAISNVSNVEASA